MKKLNFNSKSTIVLVAVISILIGMLLATVSFYKGFERGRDFLAFAVESKIKDNPSVKSAFEIQKAFRLVAESVIPAVVNISTETVIKQSFNFDENDPFFRYFGQDWFDFFFGGSPREREHIQKALGTGVIISKDGYLLTNVHVVKGATRIKVKLANGETYEAEIVGLDSKTDIALIKIKPKKDLPVASLGDSDKLEVGDWAIAVGNPFGLSHTFTVGVISAKGRSGISEDKTRYEDYIQTDASINPGNSGGPLLNINGEVVGINNSIVTPSGGNVGIGFAIPINMAKKILSQLKKTGKVIRGWLGVSIQDLDEKIAKPLKRSPNSGVLITDVKKGSPAEKADLKVGDIIVSFDGKEIKDTNGLRNLVADTQPGDKVKIEIIRKGKKKSIEVKIGEMPDEESIVKSEKASKEEWLGMKVQNITPQIASKFRVSQDESGVIVTDIDSDKEAYSQGIKVGDVIKQIDNYEIENVDDYEKFVDKYGDKDSFLFLIKRGDSLFFLGVEK